ncbi:MAG: hypothetical protein JXA41_02990 [Deltaproteobacteria bacterium]|nr:hypothetical protein [Deltaproteobacteria bacterium]
MALPITAKQWRRTARKGLFILLLAVCLCMIRPSVHPICAQEQDRTLSGSGILYPGGYDLNTIGDIHGRTKETIIPNSGPVRLNLISDGESYIVLTSPQWYWKDQKVAIPEGTDVVVRGSKSMGTDGNLYIIAQEIKIPSQNKNYVFRSDAGTPLWRGSQGGQIGPRGGGFGSPSRGGVGGGASGMGRGRR